MRFRLSSLLVAALIAGACAGTKSTTQPTAQAGTPQSQQEQSIAQSATGSQPGTVQSVRNNQLVLAPYQQGAGTATLALPNNTPVFDSSGKQVSTDPSKQLKEGQDVIVYFQARPGEAPQVTGVRELSMAEAAQVRGQYGAQAAKPGPEADMKAKADGSQSGTISSIGNNLLVLQPSQAGAGTATLTLPGNAPVFRNGQKISQSELKQGQDVRVYYQLPSGKPPQVVGVEVLSPGQQ